MKVREFKELKPLWDIMKDYSSGNFIENRDFEFINMIVRTTCCVMEKLYPGSKKVGDAFLNEYGDFDCEYEQEEVNPLFSTIIEGLLSWFSESPYWFLGYGIYGTDDVFEDGNSDLPPIDECVISELEYYSDIELLEEGNALYEHLKENYEYWEGYGNSAGPGYVVIVSYLYPYVKEMESRCGEEDEEMLAYLEKAFKEIRWWMTQGESSESVTKKAGYFLNHGGNLFDDGYGLECRDLGVCDYSFNILLAGEMVESIMFALDEKYDVLPKKLKRKGE